MDKNYSKLIETANKLATTDLSEYQKVSGLLPKSTQVDLYNKFNKSHKDKLSFLLKNRTNFIPEDYVKLVENSYKLADNDLSEYQNKSGLLPRSTQISLFEKFREEHLFNLLSIYYRSGIDSIIQYWDTYTEALKLSEIDLVEYQKRAGLLPRSSQLELYQKFREEHFSSLWQILLNSKIGERNIPEEVNQDLNKQRKSDNYAVFLSHSKKDMKLAKLLKNLLADFEITSFVAHDDIEEGERWENTIIDTIEQSKIMVVLGTRDIENSSWVNFETGLGFNKMFPLLFDKLSDRVSYIKNTQGVIVDYRDIKKTILRLVQKILSKLGINKMITSELLSSLKSFKELEDLILTEYPGKGN
jgi:hypothetical protein